MEAHDAIDSGNAAAINPAIAASTRDLDLRESQLSQHTLSKPFEGRRIELGQDAIELLPPSVLQHDFLK